MKNHLTATIAATLIAAGLFAAPALADVKSKSMAGTWSVTDTKGKKFDILLSEDGKARAERGGETMVGTWQQAGDGVEIKWNTGWLTKISKDGDGFKKAAYESGKADGEPTNTSDAERAGTKKMKDDASAAK